MVSLHTYLIVLIWNYQKILCPSNFNHHIVKHKQEITSVTYLGFRSLSMCVLELILGILGILVFVVILCCENKSHRRRNLYTKCKGRYTKLQNKRADFEQHEYLDECKFRTQNNQNVEVQVYAPQRTSNTDKLYGELIDRINQQSDLTIRFNRMELLDSIKPDEPLLVICMNVSRPNADALKAIKGIPEPTSSVLLIFHHKDAHSLPDTPSSRILTSSECVKLHGIYDMAYLTGRGVYQCDMNSIAIRNIEQFIRSYNRNEIRISQY